MDKETPERRYKKALERRYKEAKVISKHIKAIEDRLNKIPSFNGKADFVDRIHRAMTGAIALRDNLKLDLLYCR